MLDNQTYAPPASWHSARKNKWTASEIWKLFVEPKTNKGKEAGWWSETAQTYIMEKAVEAITGYRKQFSSAAMEHGVVNEAEAFESFCKLTGLDFTLTSTQFFAIDDISGASPDGVLYSDLDIVAVVDVKCPFDPMSFFEQKQLVLDTAQAQYQNVPRPYFYQMQMQMLATGAERGYLVRYLTSSHTDQYGNKYEYDLPLSSRIFFSTIHRDDAVLADMRDKIARAEAYKQELITKLLN